MSHRSFPETSSDPTDAFTIEASDVGRRLDVVVASHLEDVSRAQIKKWVEQGRVRVDGRPAHNKRLQATRAMSRA